MDGRIPENRVLSHDALEGAYLRGAYMGDVELTDGFPGGVMSYYKRMHRWVRGDWQNAPWLFRRGRDLPDLERWKLFDSLRRSWFRLRRCSPSWQACFSPPAL
jgi:membrane glycosyltransferase